MKKFLCGVLLICFMMPIGVFANEPQKMGTILMESSTGQILKGKNYNTPLPIASVTKVMVLLILAEELDKGTLSLQDEVTASPYAASAEGSVIWLEAGEKMAVSELIKSVVISSANDATIALAEKVGGSEMDFVKLMNKKVKDLNLTNTNFTGCVGYDDEKHYSTAFDVAVMTAELFKHNYYDEYFKTRLTSVRTGTEKETQLLNTNKLINFPGILGGKTGTTDNAGYCLTVCAEEGGMKLIAVTLGGKSDDDRTGRCRKMLESGFNEYERYTAIIDENNLPTLKVPDGVMKKVPLRLKERINCIIPKGEEKNVKYEITVPEEWQAPLTEGEKVGEINGTVNGKPLYKMDIVAAKSSPKLTFKKAFTIMFEAFF